MMSAWFWLCAIGYPVLAWSFLFVSRMAYRRIARCSALAQNRLSEQVEQTCHDAASRPLAIHGYGWRFSSDDEENSVQSFLDEKLESGLRPSAAFPGNDVHARWIDVPGEPFYPGNELGEHTRQLAVCDWLITNLMDELSGPLSRLPSSTFLDVHLCLHSRLKREPVAIRLQRALNERYASIDLRIESTESLLVFATDDWLDRRDKNTVHLVIAIQLRDAISILLDAGQAEAGAAILLGDPRSFEDQDGNALRLHRPAKGPMDTAAEVIDLASRWGMANKKDLEGVWIQGLPVDDLAGIRRLTSLDDALPWRSIEASVGDCSVAGGWLAVVLAAARADSGSNPQLVLSAQGSDLSALVCR